jgi:hypothetical protein
MAVAMHKADAPVKADVPESSHAVFATEEHNVITQEFQAHRLVLDLLVFNRGIPIFT